MDAPTLERALRTALDEVESAHAVIGQQKKDRDALRERIIGSCGKDGGPEALSDWILQKPEFRYLPQNLFVCKTTDGHLVQVGLPALNFVRRMDV